MFIILFLLKIIFLNSLTINNKRILNNHYSEIHLVIQGSGKQNLLNNGFVSEPSQVLVNGIKNDLCKKNCVLEGDTNNITLIFQYQILLQD